jgi:hypothetical protein
MERSDIIGIIGLVIAGVTLLYTYKTQSKNKSLSYAVSDTQIISFKEKIPGVVVTWHGIPVKNLRLEWLE